MVGLFPPFFCPFGGENEIIRINVRIFVTNVRDMTTEKKSRKKKYPVTPEQTDKDKVEEPAQVYAFAAIAGGNDFMDAGLSRSMELLGIVLSFKPKKASAYDYITVIREGIYKESMDRLMKIAGLTSAEMASLVHTSDRTLRRYQDRHKLNPDQSERLIELARLYARGEEVFEDMALFREWMDTPLPALGHQTPKSFLDTSIGIDMLLKQLQRIEHGTYS